MSGKSGKTVEVSDELYERLVRYRAEIELKTGIRFPMRDAIDMYVRMSEMVGSK